jgi:hypothetical protein
MKTINVYIDYKESYDPFVYLDEKNRFNQTIPIELYQEYETVLDSFNKSNMLLQQKVSQIQSYIYAKQASEKEKELIDLVLSKENISRKEQELVLRFYGWRELDHGWWKKDEVEKPLREAFSIEAFSICENIERK